MPYTLNAFHQALQRNPHAVAELKPRTYIRYVQGEFPPIVDWLMKYPALLRALAVDAEGMQQAACKKETEDE